MLQRPQDVLVLQTYHTWIQRDLDLIFQLSIQCALSGPFTVETGMAPVPGFPLHASFDFLEMCEASEMDG
jgi:hypothetical protein